MCLHAFVITDPERLSPSWALSAARPGLAARGYGPAQSLRI
jgi:hypothetical protein